jgi:hypothetical protein
MRIPRTRGAVSGVLLMILGAWGALVPFIGHYLNLAVGPDTAWQWTAGHGWLSVLPGAVVFLGGLLLLAARTRPTGAFGAWLGIAGGAWFVIGQFMSELWNHGVPQTGVFHGGTGHRVAEQMLYFTGLGALIVAIAAFALGRLAVRSVRDVELAAAEAATADGPTATAEPRRFGRRAPRERVGAGTSAAAGTAGPATRFGRDPVADEPVTTTAGTAADEHVTTTTGAADGTATPTLTAADRVREAAQPTGRRGFFRRNR